MSSKVLMMVSVLMASLTCGCGVTVSGVDGFGETASVVLLRSELLPEASDDPWDSSQDEVRNLFILSTVEDLCVVMGEAVAAADVAEQHREESLDAAGLYPTEAQYEAIDAVYYEAMAEAFLPVRGAGERELVLRLGTYNPESRVYGEPREDTFVEQDQWWREEEGARDVAAPSNDLWFDGYFRYITLDPYTVDIADRPSEWDFYGMTAGQLSLVDAGDGSWDLTLNGGKLDYSDVNGTLPPEGPNPDAPEPSGGTVRVSSTAQPCTVTSSMGFYEW